MQEEARHILFVVNWVAYLRARTPWALRPGFDGRFVWTLGGQLLEHARNALRFGGGGASQEGFMMGSHSAFGELSARSFLEVCLAENDRRLAGYDARLPRPRLVPAAVRLALRFLPSGENGKASTVAASDAAPRNRRSA
jgi:hypothetical protein